MYYSVATGYPPDNSSTDNYTTHGETRSLPTQGDIQWGKLMHALEGIGYEGVFMYEATKDHENDNTRPTPERVVETFNKIINDYKNQK